MKFMQKFNEPLVSKLFLISVIQNVNVRTHLTLVGTCWPQELPVEHTVALINDKIHGKNNHNANTVPSYAVEAT